MNKSSHTAVIVNGARTPVGKFKGLLRNFSSIELGALAIRGAINKSKIKPSEVDYVIMGQVLTAGTCQIPARQAALAAGINWNIPALTVSKVCLSGINAIILASQLIKSGEFEVIVAGGQESMSQAPGLFYKNYKNFDKNSENIVEHLSYDGLHDVFTNKSMGSITEQRNNSENFTKTEQDLFAKQSHLKASIAWRNGVYNDEVVPILIQNDNSYPNLIIRDEGIRSSTTVDSLMKLKSAFYKNGTITAGSSSQISDGAAAVIVMNKAKAERLKLKWLCEVGAHSVVAGPDSTLQDQPANAIKKALSKEGITIDKLNIIEINEAFAAATLTSIKKLNINIAKININGGGIAIGHPIGASGARIILHAALELSRLGSGYAIAALCGGSGQGDALILRC